MEYGLIFFYFNNSYPMNSHNGHVWLNFFIEEIISYQNPNIHPNTRYYSAHYSLFCARWSYFSVFFFPWHPKCPWHMFFQDLSRALLAFHGHFFVNCHGHFFVYFSHESGNPFIKKKCPWQFLNRHFFEKCHGQFTAFTGTFSKIFTGNQKLSRGKKTLYKFDSLECF